MLVLLHKEVKELIALPVFGFKAWARQHSFLPSFHHLCIKGEATLF